MWKVEVSYSVYLMYATLEDAHRAEDILFEGGVKEVTVKYVPVEEVEA